MERPAGFWKAFAEAIAFVFGCRIKNDADNEHY